jgi:hypothetical protein
MKSEAVLVALMSLFFLLSLASQGAMYADLDDRVYTIETIRIENITVQDEIPTISIEEWEAQVNLSSNNTYGQYYDGDTLLIYGNVTSVNNNNHRIYMNKTYFYYPYFGEIPNLSGRLVNITIQIFASNKESMVCKDVSW